MSNQTCWDPLLCVGLAGFTWLLGLVGLDAAHVPGLLGHQDLSQTHQTVLELSHHLERRRMFAAVCRQRYIVIIIVTFRTLAYSFWSPLAVWFGRRETVFDNSILGLSHDLRDGGRIME